MREESAELMREVFVARESKLEVVGEGKGSHCSGVGVY